MTLAGAKRFHCPVVIEWSSYLSVPDIIASASRRILVIGGRASLQRELEEISARLEPGNCVRIARTAGVTPTSLTVDRTVEDARSFHPDWVVAIGGGSVMDTGKLVALLCSHPGSVLDYLHGRRSIHGRDVSLLAVPSTAGTGTEVTPFASVVDEEEKRKVSLTHPCLYPDFALLDPTLTYDLPPIHAATSGMDALSQSIEGLWAKGATSVTDACALQAVRLVWGSVEAAIAQPPDRLAKQAMMYGSNLAGLAISNAKTTAVHAASYPLTVHFGVPHGAACGIFLPGFIRYNQGSLGDAKEEMLLEATRTSSMEDLACAVEGLLSRVGLPERLRDVGVNRDDIGLLVSEGARPDRAGNNPRAVSEDALRELVEEAW